MSKNELLQLIERKRKELGKIVSQHGLNSATTLQYSQELDCLLNKYNNIY
ncbi:MULTISPECIES: aspartyl-phosphate phosphatase Spo0E family protein [Bacillus]|nr:MULTISPECIES: aspartyl-phosphate phosphatase Spo0E family protein [Bacillus]